MTAKVAIIGANGHGMWHRRGLRPLHENGTLRLVGLCDVNPIESAPDAPIPDGAATFADHQRMLADTEPDVVIIATPPHTHLGIATDALRAGADVLLEKPPVLDLAEHDKLAAVAADTGRVIQVGFQALGSGGLAELRAAIADGRLGELTGIAVAGSWQRPDAYYRRSPWAGRRELDGRRIIDGALANPFAHTIMQALAIAGDPTPVEVELDWYRARDIQVDDTSSLRISTDIGVPILIAVTLCGRTKVEGEITVRGTGGEAWLEYPTDRLRLPGDHEPRKLDRTGMVVNLLAHRADGTPLIAPLERTRGFTAVLSAIGRAPAPALIGDSYRSREPDPEVVVVAGADEAVLAAARRTELFAECGAAWAVGARPWRSGLTEVMRE